MDAGLWADVACVALDRGVRFLLMGDFRQLPAVLDSFAGARVERPLKDCDLLRDLAGGYCHELTENRRSDERIFQFISWLRIGEAEEVPLAEAVRLARREFPRPAGQHAHRVQINERENRRLAPADAVVIEHQAPGAPTTADDASLARAAAGGRRRQGGQGHLRAGGRGGRGARRAGRRAAAHPRRAAAAHAAVPRHHLRELSGADAPRPGVVARRGHAALQPAAPLRRGQPGDQLGAAERALGWVGAMVAHKRPNQLWGWPTNDGAAVGPIKAIKCIKSVKFIKPSPGLLDQAKCGLTNLTDLTHLTGLGSWKKTGIPFPGAPSGGGPRGVSEPPWTAPRALALREASSGGRALLITARG